MSEFLWASVFAFLAGCVFVLAFVSPRIYRAGIEAGREELKHSFDLGDRNNFPLSPKGQGGGPREARSSSPSKASSP